MLLLARGGNPRPLLLPVALVLACGKPTIVSLDPSSGPERTLVAVHGNTGFAGVLWDAGTAEEKEIASGFVGADMFSVPPGAAPGPHNVQLILVGNRSNTVVFNVTPPLPFGAPRLERIGLRMTEFRPNNRVAAWLMVQAANADVGAKVFVDGTVQPTLSYLALRNDLLGIQPTSLGYPIYHYLLLRSPCSTSSEPRL